MPKRLVVETSNEQKETLDLFLQEKGTTLSEWFSDRVAEATAPYLPRLGADPHGEILSLEEIGDPKKVFRRLSARDWALTEAETGYLTHNLHPYPAKFIPQIPNALIRSLSLRGELVWDPFGGSGTTALEAILLGRRALSSDVNPLAALIGKAKTTPLSQPSVRALARLHEKLEILARDHSALAENISFYSREIAACIPAIPNSDKWFHPDAVRELAFLRFQIGQIDDEPARGLASAAFSRVIVRVSFQDNETRYASKPREVSVGDVVRLYAGDLASAVSKAKALPHHLDYSDVAFATSDLRAEKVVEPNSVDLIVTSPPYPNATDYHLYHRFRLLWLGHSPQELGKKEIGSHLRHQKEASGIDSYVEEMTQCLQRMFTGLRPGRYSILVLGDGVFSGTTHSSVELLTRAAKTIGFEIVGDISRPVHATRRSFIGAARRLKHEDLLVLRKPHPKMLFVLNEPAYTMWPFEKVLRRREVEALAGGKGVDLGPRLQLSSDRPIADLLRRLTFTSSFVSASYSKERTWQAVLENGNTGKLRSRKDPKYATHGLHAYKGKFYPQLAKSLFALADLKPGGRVLDPFCGSGTVLLEGYLNGLSAIGMDLNPLAVKIARAKVGILSIDQGIVDRILQDVISRVQEVGSGEALEGLFEEGPLAELSSWFPAKALRKLGTIQKVIEGVIEPTVRELLEICLSNIVRIVSHQDPRDLRIRRRKEVLNDAPVVQLYVDQVSEQQRRLRHFAQQRNWAPTSFMPAALTLGDSRVWSTYTGLGVKQRSVDAVVTSPPYATALPYIDTDRLSLLLLLGMKSKERTAIEESLTGSREIAKVERTSIEDRIEEREFRDIKSRTAINAIIDIYERNKASDVGFRRKNQGALLFRYYQSMTRTFSNLDRCLRPGASAFFVIGDNRTIAGGKEITIPSGQILRETGLGLGWKHVESIPITVTKEARPHSRNSITRNEILWFRRD